jgi:large subunit ribosomal protein L22
MMSPRKVRRVVKLIKGKSVEDALTILKFTNKAAAQPLAKTIQSATANALAVEGTSRLKAEDLSIARIAVDEGPRAKRVRFRAMGRVFRYKKRFAHLTVVVEGEPQEEAAPKRRTLRKSAKTETDTAKKPAAKKTTAKKSTAKKTTAKKTAAKKTTTKKSTAKSAADEKKGGAKKTAAKKTTKAAPKKKAADKKED